MTGSRGFSLERRAHLRMARELVLARDVEQPMQQARVADVEAGRLDLAFPQVLEPRREHPDHERPGQDVEMAAGGRFAGPEGARQLGRVPRPAVIEGNRPGTAAASPPEW